MIMTIDPRRRGVASPYYIPIPWIIRGWYIIMNNDMLEFITINLIGILVQTNRMSCDLQIRCWNRHVLSVKNKRCGVKRSRRYYAARSPKPDFSKTRKRSKKWMAENDRWPTVIFSVDWNFWFCRFDDKNSTDHSVEYHNFNSSFYRIINSQRFILVNGIECLKLLTLIGLFQAI